MGTGPSEEILEWAKRQPRWRQDALRRIISKSFTGADEAEVLELLAAEHGIAQTELTPIALDAKHLPIRSTDASSIRLVAVEDVANVNRLSKDASLRLAPEGVTVIYGDNGSGKSGFIRLLKKACRARVPERILPNVFAASLGNSPASARFTVIDGAGQSTSVSWVDDGHSSPDLLGRVAVFDSKCAGVHVDGENRIEVIPHNLDCFEKLAELSDRLRLRLKAQCEDLEKQLAGALPTVPQGTAAAKFLTDLKSKTEQDLGQAGAWTAVDHKRLGELDGMLKDPASEAQRCQRLSDALSAFTVSLTAATSALSVEAVAKISQLRKEARELRIVADASALDRFESEPLKKVGDVLWAAMFEAAKQYSEQDAYPGTTFPAVSDGCRCVLCQQPLEAEGQDRMRRFSEHFFGALNEKARAAEGSRDSALNALRSDVHVPEIGKEARDYLDTLDRSPLAECDAFRAALLKRRQMVLDGLEEVEPLPLDPTSVLTREAGALSKAAAEAKELATNASGESSIGLRAEHSELLGKKAIHENENELKRRITIYGRIKKLNTAMRACATKDISDHGGALLRKHVTGTLAAALSAEQTNLGISGIPIALNDRTAKAVVQHRLKLDGATLGADTSAVLSEGEHRAVALAAFLSELSVYPSKDAIILDDPVSSLDHIRRGKVAERLVMEGRERQVIVFTHDLVFLSEARHYAAKSVVPLNVIAVRRGATGFGFPDPDGEPWQAKELKGRRHWLTEQLSKLKKLHAEASEEYEPQARYFYDRLRESWEKLIEEKLFAQVVCRFQPQVQTLRLKEAVIDDDLVADIFFAMTEVSSFTGHDRPEAKGAALPEPVDCEKHLKEFTDCMDSAEAKSKAAAKSRESRLKAPKA